MSRDMLDMLFGAGMSVIMSTADSDLARSIRSILSVPILLFDEAAPGLLQVGGLSLLLDELPSPPTCLCILVAGSVSGATALLEFSEWWDKHGAQSAPSVQTLPPALTPEGASSWILEGLLRISAHVNAETSTMISRLQDQILLLRQHNEDLQEAVMQLRALVPQVEQVPFIVCQPGGDVLDPTNCGKAATFCFPLRAYGISRIDLHAQAGEPTEGTLRIALTGIDHSDIFGVWEVPFDSVSGWVALNLRESLTTRSTVVTLNLTWQIVTGTGPRLSLSETYLELPGAGTFGSPETTVHLPALRLYRGVPGQHHDSPQWWIPLRTI